MLQGWMGGTWRALVSGLAQTPGEIRFLFLGVLVALLATIGRLVLQNRKTYLGTQGEIQGVYEALADRFSLTADERGLLETAASYLKSDEPWFVLLIDPRRFASCLQSARRHRSIPDDLVDGLRGKLRFTTEESEVPISTAQMVIGDSLVLLLASKRLIRGRVVGKEPRAVMAEIAGFDELPPVESQVKLFVKRKAGIFTFETTVSKCLGRTVHLSHSRSGQRYQRRQYFRKDTPTSVLVKTLGKEDVYLASTLYDLSGGGASMANPDTHFSAGDSLLVYFSSSEETFTLPAQVVRVSAQGTVLHIAFDSIDDVTRDRLISTIV